MTTDWVPSTVNPEQPGWYEVLLLGIHEGLRLHWDGEKWSKSPKMQPFFGYFRCDAWRYPAHEQKEAA